MRHSWFETQHGYITIALNTHIHILAVGAETHFTETDFTVISQNTLGLTLYDDYYYSDTQNLP